MAKLKLSPELIHGLELIGSLEDYQLDGITQYIKSMPIGVPLKTVQDHLSSNLNIGDAYEVFSTITAVVEFIYDHKDDDSFDDLMESAQSSPTVNLEKVKTILTEILKHSKNIALSQKSAELLVENSNNFSECKVITDIRLVFNENITDENRNAVLIHKLHFSVSRPSNTRDIFIHLDSEDLAKLKETIERAILKEDLIKENYENIKFISFSDAKP